MTSALIITTLALFFAAALVEIGGGYLVWRWLREKRTWLIKKHLHIFQIP